MGIIIKAATAAESIVEKLKRIDPKLFALLLVLVAFAIVEFQFMRLAEREDDRFYKQVVLDIVSERTGKQVDEHESRIGRLEKK